MACSTRRSRTVLLLVVVILAALAGFFLYISLPTAHRDAPNDTSLPLPSPPTVEDALPPEVTMKNLEESMLEADDDLVEYVPQRKKEMALVGTLRDNFLFLEPYCSFYGSYWQMDHIFLAIGISPRTNVSQLMPRLNRIAGTDCEKISVRGRVPAIVTKPEFYLCGQKPYQRPRHFGMHTQFSYMLYNVPLRKVRDGENAEIHGWVEAALEQWTRKYAGRACMNCDEYYFHPDPSAGRRMSEWAPHTVEFKPHPENFDISRPFTWVSQAFYYRARSMELDCLPWCHPWDLRVSMRGGVTRIHSNIFHAATSTCKSLENTLDPASLLRGQDMHVMYHFSCVSKAYYMYKKHKDHTKVASRDGSQNMGSETHSGAIPDDLRVDLENRFKKYFSDPESQFLVWEDDRLKRYFEPYWVLNSDDFEFM